MRSPDRSSAVGGVAGASVAAGTGGAGGKRGVNFGGAVDGERPLSDKYAPASADAGTETYREQRASSARVPESPPPPPPSSSRQAKLDGVKWGALAESLRLQVSVLDF